jgi:polyphosphate kinase 2 (PPK2 family)
MSKKNDRARAEKDAGHSAQNGHAGATSAAVAIAGDRTGGAYTAAAAEAGPRERPKMSAKALDKELEPLQVELVRLQEWAKHTGAKVCVLFEGRDAAGKGGIIKRLTERTSPRVFRVVALPAPTERE